jgi:hypothetical protein
MKDGSKAGWHGNAGGQEFRQTDKCAERHVYKYTYRNIDIQTYTD